MILETFFAMEEKHAISVQNFHEEQTFRDLYAASGRDRAGDAILTLRVII
jgi:hypothetical protein